MVGLSKRLLLIAEHVPQGSRLADIGSDHGLLPVYLAQNGIIVSAIAGELNRGPFTAAFKQVQATGMSSKIMVRQGNGLEVINTDEADVITIAGMGGLLIVQILTEGIAKLKGIKRLVLQPNVGEEAVRRWLLEQGWFLSAECILEEDGKIYEVLIADRIEQAESKNRLMYKERNVDHTIINLDLLLRMGPYMLEQADPIWIQKWEEEINKLQRIVDQLARSSQTISQHRRELIQTDILNLQEVLACSQKVKPSFK